MTRPVLDKAIIFVALFQALLRAGGGLLCAEAALLANEMAATANPGRSRENR